MTHTRIKALQATKRLGESAPTPSELIAILPEAQYDPKLLGELAPLLWEWGYRQAAISGLQQALSLAPDSLTLISLLASYYLALSQVAAAEALLSPLSSAAQQHPEVALVMGRLRQRQWRWPEAQALWRLAFAQSPLLTRAAWQAPNAIKVLVLADPAAVNTPVGEFLTPDRFVCLYWHIQYWSPAVPLPEHDVVFNAIGDLAAGLARDANFKRLYALSNKPMLNIGAGIEATQRDQLSHTLAGIAHCLVAPVERHPSTAAATFSARAGEWLLRPVGTHTGEHFYRTATPAERLDIVARVGATEWYVMPFIDTRTAYDQLYRKYRMVWIDGQWYPMHVAFSDQWKVHYFSSLPVTAAHAAEQERFLRDPRAVLGPLWVVFAAIAERIDLDFFGVDFAINAQGQVVIFEANATMVLARDPSSDARSRQAGRLNDMLADWVTRQAQPARTSH